MNDTKVWPSIGDEPDEDDLQWLDIPQTAYRALSRAGFDTMTQVDEASPILLAAVPNLGVKGLGALWDALQNGRRKASLVPAQTGKHEGSKRLEDMGTALLFLKRTDAWGEAWYRTWEGEEPASDETIAAMDEILIKERGVSRHAIDMRAWRSLRRSLRLELQARLYGDLYSGYGRVPDGIPGTPLTPNEITTLTERYLPALHEIERQLLEHGDHIHPTKVEGYMIPGVAHARWLPYCRNLPPIDDTAAQGTDWAEGEEHDRLEAERTAEVHARGDQIRQQWKANQLAAFNPVMIDETTDIPSRIQASTYMGEPVELEIISKEEARRRGLAPDPQVINAR